MKLKQTLEFSWLFKMGALALAIQLSTPGARANIYATNIKIDGTTTNATISYILNEPASLGVELDIAAGSSVVRRLVLPPGGSGTDRGLNSVVWDGTDNNSNAVPGGTYHVSITAASSGYTNWTQITSDGDPGTYVWFGRGIAVDRNATNPYYGRVFVANSQDGPNPDTTPGDIAGILKLNADSSFADEGASSTGQDGYNWSGNALSPWKVRVSTDDFVYVSDLSIAGEVFRWDPLMSSNSLVSVLRSDNIPSGAQLSGPAIVGAGTNTEIWMADTNGANGILRWRVTSNGVCATNDPGKSIVGIGTDPVGGLSLGPISVALDSSGNIYTCQTITNSGDPTPRVFRFRTYDPSTNGGNPELTADWAVGTNDDTYAGASGLAVDPSGTYVAVTFEGLQIGGLYQDGNTKVLYATNGALAANVDLGLAIGGDANHQDTDCDWDAVGNLYYIDNWFGVWRAFSPPGTNQSTTLALATIQISGGGSPQGPPPSITKISVAGGTVTIDFTAATTDVAASFLVSGAAAVTGPYSPVSNATITLVSAGLFRATLTANAAMQYFRIQRQGSAPPPPPSNEQPEITSISFAGNTVTLQFAALTNDVSSGFLVLGATAVTGPYTAVQGAAITQTGPGLFRATFSNPGAMGYFRIQRQGGSAPPPSSQPPQITSLAVSNGTVVLTFTGSATNSASQFTLLSAATPAGPYAPSAGATITQSGSGTFRASAPAKGSIQFYRLLR